MADAISFDKAAQAWTLTWDPDWVTSVCFLGSTRRIAAGNKLGQILLWDLPDKAGPPAPSPLRRLDGHKNTITHLVATADGRWLISSSYDHTIRYWDMQAEAKGSETIVLNAHAIEEAKAHRSSKVPAPVPATFPIQQSARTLQAPEWVNGLTLSRDNKLLISGDDASNVIFWDREAGKELKRWKVKRWAHVVALSPDGKQMYITEFHTPGQHEGAKIWDVETGKEKFDLKTNFKEFREMYVEAAAFSPDGKVLAVIRGGEAGSGPNGIVYLFDPATGKKLRELAPGHICGGTDVVFHPSGNYLASAGRDTIVRLWNVADGKLLKELSKPRGGQFKDWIHNVSFSADGRWLAAADMAGAVQIWSLG